MADFVHFHGGLIAWPITDSNVEREYIEGQKEDNKPLQPNEVRETVIHELGHYFGNPHSQVIDNVMSYERSGAAVFFDADQGRRIAARARAYVKSGELLPVP